MGGSILQATGKSVDLIANSYGDYIAKIKALAQVGAATNFYPSRNNVWKFPFTG
jgi:hypothetical protein